MKLFISLVKKTVDTLVTYGEEVIYLVESSGVPDLGESRSFTEMKQSYGLLVTGYNKERKSTFTVKLLALNEARKHSYRSMRIAVQSSLYSDDPSEVSAAQILFELFKKYGTQFQNLSYPKISAKIHLLIESFSAKDASAAIVSLKLYNKLVKLVNDEKQFEECYRQSLDQRQNSKAVSSATAVRRVFEKAMGRFITYLEVRAMEESNPKLQSLCAAIVTLNDSVEAMQVAEAAAEEIE